MRNINLYLYDIKDSISKIEQYCDTVSEEEFLANFEKQDAVLRRLEIIGEAVKKIPQNLKEKHSNIPWKNISGMRNVITHEYFGVDIKKVWLILENDIKILKKAIIEIINSVEDNLQIPFDK